MYNFVRTARHHEGKAQEAFAFAVNVANYINENYPETKVQVTRNVYGPIDYIYWVADFESQAVLEGLVNKLNADGEYLQLLAEAEGLLVGSSVEDNLYVTVP